MNSSKLRTLLAATAITAVLGFTGCRDSAYNEKATPPADQNTPTSATDSTTGTSTSGSSANDVNSTAPSTNNNSSTNSSGTTTPAPSSNP